MTDHSDDADDQPEDKRSDRPKKPKLKVMMRKMFDVRWPKQRGFSVRSRNLFEPPDSKSQP